MLEISFISFFTAQTKNISEWLDPNSKQAVFQVRPKTLIKILFCSPLLSKYRSFN